MIPWTLVVQIDYSLIPSSKYNNNVLNNERDVLMKKYGALFMKLLHISIRGLIFRRETFRRQKNVSFG